MKEGANGTAAQVPEPLYTPAEAAVVLRCTPRTVREYVRRGALGAKRTPGGTILIPATKLQAFIDRFDDTEGQAN